MEHSDVSNEKTKKTTVIKPKISKEVNAIEVNTVKVNTINKIKPSVAPNPQIIFDVREEYLIETISKHDSSIKWTKQMLPVGDILFNYGDKTLVLIERKTLNDLHSSIQDGRYKEQKLRITDSKIPQKYYLVEGSLKGYKGSPGDVDRLYSAILNTTVRDRIPVLRTEDLNDTVRTLAKIYNTLLTHGPLVLANSQITANQSNITDADYVETLRPNKKENLTPDVCYLSQLTQIPGVSHIIANRIKENYPNFKALLTAYDKIDDKASKILLKDLVLPTGRKIGPVVSCRVYEYIMFDETKK